MSCCTPTTTDLPISPRLAGEIQTVALVGAAKFREDYSFSIA